MIFSRNAAARTTAVMGPGSVRASEAMQPVVQEISHAMMRSAFNEGRAVALTPAITDIVRYDGSWWLLDRDSWLRVTDAALVADLDAFAERFGR